MFESIANFFKKVKKIQEGKENKESAKERLHLVLLQDRANVSADFLDMMKQEIIDVIKKYIDIDENEIDVKLTNKQNSDGTTGAPALYANIPIVAIKNETRKLSNKMNLEKSEIKNEKDENNKEVKESDKDKDKNKEKTETQKENKNQEVKKEDKKEENTENTKKEDQKAEENKEKENKKENKKVDQNKKKAKK